MRRPRAKPSSTSTHEAYPPLSCPDCAGVLRIEAQGPRGHPLYVCQVGHRYSTPSLLHSKEMQLERTLWSAAVLLKQMGDAYEQLLKEMSQEDSERNGFSAVSTG